MLQSAQRRAQPMDLGPSSDAGAPLGAPLVESAWVRPIADSAVLAPDSDPADVAAEKETLRLAFVAALQHLPPRQRAVLILREVLRWQATEVAELLETSVASVNSALQRARATIEELELDTSGPSQVSDAEQRELLAGYVEAFERYDITSLVKLLHDDAAFSMPPFPLWVRGPGQIHDFMLGTGAKCEGSRLLVTQANGGPAVAIYNPTDDGYTPWAIVVLEMSGGTITGLHHFIYPELFAQFGLPPRLDREDARQPYELQ
jgi:RNA polymerase sigma-70 factor (ECF subfamily)